MKKNTIMSFLAYKTLRFSTLLVAIFIICFLLISNSPIDPVRAYIGADMMGVSVEQKAKIEQYWGLNKSPIQQAGNWLKAVSKGDLGNSLIYRKPVIGVIGEKFQASLLLMAVAWIFSGIIGFALGVISGMNQGRFIDRIIKFYCLTLASTPTFWLGLLMLIIFAVKLRLFPIGLGVPIGVLSNEITFAEKINHLILPAITLSIIGVSTVALHTREKIITVLNTDYVLFARARGEKGFALFSRHIFRNILLPFITIQFTSFGELFGGSVLAEQVFSYPGLGQATILAGTRGDVPLLLGIALFSAIFVFIGNLIADILYYVVDPRIREVETI